MNEQIPGGRIIKQLNRNLSFYFSEATGQPFARPHWIYISLSHECVYRCKMCEVVKILKGKSLETGMVKKALWEISGWDNDGVVTFTGGEPFLRQDIFDIFAFAQGLDINYEVVSNGALIDTDLARKIVSSGLQNIAVSLDGATAATHDFVRQPGSFDRAITALKNLVRAKKNNGTGPQISVWTTIMKENVGELYDFIPLAEELGVECLVYHPVIVAQDDMQNTSAQAPFWISSAESLAELEKQIVRIEDYRGKNGLVAFLHDPYLWTNYFKGDLSRQQWKCNPFVFINIGPDAAVRSCGEEFGNLHEFSLEECLRSADARKARAMMKNCQKPCLQTCWAHPESDSLEKIITRFSRQLRESGLNPTGKLGLIEKAEMILNSYSRQIKGKESET